MGWGLDWRCVLRAAAGLYGFFFSGGRRHTRWNCDWSSHVCSSDLPRARAFHSAVWTGREMIVWSGSDASNVDTGDIYDPVSDNWTATSTLNAPVGRVFHTAIWTGRCMQIGRASCRERG